MDTTSVQVIHSFAVFNTIVYSYFIIPITIVNIYPTSINIVVKKAGYVYRKGKPVKRIKHSRIDLILYYCSL